MSAASRPSSRAPWCGVFSLLPGGFSIELLGAVGFDFVCIDLQHGLADESAVSHGIATLQGTAMVPLVRPLTNDPGTIGRALDLGAHGVIVPMVQTAQEAADAVAACRYGPHGIRSYGPVRSGVPGGGDPAATRPLCLVMIETELGTRNAADIAATPGLDGIFVGPADLALSLGLGLADIHTSPVHVEAVARIRSIALAHGLIAGMHCFDAASARQALVAGFTMVSVGSDIGYLRDGATAALCAARPNGST